MRRGQADYLFHEGDWFATSEQWRQKLRHEIESQNGDELLNSSTVDLAAYYAGKFTLNVPTLHEDEIVVDKKETQIDVSHDRDRYFSGRSGPHYITGTEIMVEVPFTGDEVGFRIQPTTQNYNNPTAKISGQKIFFSITGTNLTSEKVNSEIKGKLTSINQHLEWLRRDASAFNANLSQIATESIEQRKAKLLKDKSLLAGLDFKMKERPGEKQTYATPNVRRTIRPEVPKPAASRQPFKPEPVIADADYEHILKVLDNMVKVMEQSPGAFQKIDEESLRTHFLVQLNGHFDGNATGETFNYEGKTDILIKVDGKMCSLESASFGRERRLTLRRWTKSYHI